MRNTMRKKRKNRMQAMMKRAASKVMMMTIINNKREKEPKSAKHQLRYPIYQGSMATLENTKQTRKVS